MKNASSSSYVPTDIHDATPRPVEKDVAIPRPVEKMSILHNKRYSLMYQITASSSTLNLNSKTGISHARFFRCSFGFNRIKPDVFKNYKNVNTSERVQINISGKIFETLASTLDKYPETILGTKIKRELLRQDERTEIFLNRNRGTFDAILFYYQSGGILLKPYDVTMKDFEIECKFFEISLEAIKTMKERESYLFLRKITLSSEYSRRRENMYRFLDYPFETNMKAAELGFYISYAFIILSIILYCIESEIKHQIVDVEERSWLITLGYCFEMFINIYFAIEYMLRLCSVPYIKEFYKDAINSIELITVFAYFPAFFLPYNQSSKEALINMTRLLRPLRLTRISKISDPARIALVVLRKSIRDVFTVCVCVMTVVILFGSIMFFIECDEPGTHFESIPQSMWWAIQSVICLGYGDIIPQTGLGKGIGCLLLLFGVVTVAVLILSLGGRFFDTYSKELYEKGWFIKDDLSNYDKQYEKLITAMK